MKLLHLTAPLLVIVVASCADDAIAETHASSDDTPSTAAVESSSSSPDPTLGASSDGTALDSATTTTQADSGTGTDEGSSTAGTESDATESSTGASSDDPALLCAAALDETECTSIEIDAGELGQASCVWLDVHTLQVADAGACSPATTTPRCMFFSGFQTGCGGGPGCPPPNDSQIYLRELGRTGTVELLFYPSEDICGPLPTAAMDEPAWSDCGFPYHPACECICEAL
jgi:hypothetical protein